MRALSPRTITGPSSYGDRAQPRKGFFTDTSVCIGCKACEVACKEWNQIPVSEQRFTGHSYDNTVELGANTWRHVAFVEQRLPVGVADGASPLEAAMRARAAGVGVETDQAGADVGPRTDPGAADPGPRTDPGTTDPGPRTDPGAADMGRPTDPKAEVRVEQERSGVRWLMASDVCKHCTDAACLEVCPTGALFRTEFGTVVVQPDVCNGCGYCVPACPFGVLDRRRGDGRAWKCTLCYDRLKADMEPACAQACPTNSIQYGDLVELRARAERRLAQLRQAGESRAQLYLADEDDGIGGAGAFFLLLDEPETYGLPPDPVDTRHHLGEIWAAAAVAAAALGVGLAAVVIGTRP